MTPVDLGEIVASARANLGLDDGNEVARITVEQPLPILPGVPIELVRLFQNLIGNAVKYRHPDRLPEIRIGARRNGGEWIISVADNGIGIDPEHFERIFGMFQRLHGEGEFEGTGIGLAICRKIVTTHHGRIWVESEYGRGCTFLVALPAVSQNGPGQPAH